MLRLVFSFALAFAATSARAALPLLQLERFEPDPSARGSIALGGGETLEAGKFRFSGSVGWVHSPLYAEQGDATLRVIGERFTLHLGAAFGFNGVIEAGLRLPVVVFQSSDDLSALGLSQVATA